ncbi:MAG: glycoside hydrolase domain-containing protein [Armatimonadota bacterium]
MFACLSLAVSAVVLRTASTDEPGGSALEKATTFAYYPGLRKLEVRVSAVGSADAQRLTAEVRAQGEGRAVARRAFLATNKGGACLISLPRLRDGVYELTVSTADGSQHVVRHFKHRNFEWLGNDLGKSRTVYPPFEPVQVHGTQVRVVLRTYRMNRFGLWDSVVSQGKELLAAPIVLRAVVEGKQARWRFRKGRWRSLAVDTAVYEAEAETDAVRVRTISTVEYDGCMRVELALLPGRQKRTIQRMWLEIPIKDSEAPLFHYTAFEGMRRNYAGKTPRGGRITWLSQPYDSAPWPLSALPPLWKAELGSSDGVIWTCRDTRPWKHVIATDFVPYIWLGGAERGIAFFGANDKAYLLDPKGKVQTIERRRGVLYLRVDFVNKPSVIREKRQIVFGLQAGPTRPMEHDWRVKHKITPGMPGPVVCWGGYICANKYPEGYHWNVVDEIVRVRRTGIVNRSAFERMDMERAEPWKKPWGGTGAPGFDTWLDRDFWWFVNRAKELHDRSDWRKIAAEGGHPAAVAKVLANPSWITYFEEHASDVSEPEWEVFQDEWRAEWPWTKDRTEVVGQQQPVNNFAYGHQAFPDSYIDFCLYYINEWFKRGVGVYFDNTMPYTVYNPLLSDAYLDETGAIQPACTIWEQRRYYKRVWQLMNEVQRKGVPYPLAFAQHITNTRLLPWNTWCTITLDLEWEWFPDPVVPERGRDLRPMPASSWQVRLPFPPDLLLAETAGRQTGTMGDAHFGILGNPQYEAFFPPTYARGEWGMRAVHELNARGSEALDAALWKFGYGTEQTRVVNYWTDDPPVKVTDPEHNKWLLVIRKSDRSLLLVLQTWHRSQTVVEVHLKPPRLGFRPAAEACDVETGKAVPFSGTHLRLSMPAPYGTRVVVLGRRDV